MRGSGMFSVGDGLGAIFEKLADNVCARVCPLQRVGYSTLYTRRRLREFWRRAAFRGRPTHDRSNLATGPCTPEI